MASQPPNSDSPNPSVDRPQRWAYHNDRWVRSDRLALSVDDVAITHAATAVERVRRYGQTFFQLERHLDRWQRTTAALHLKKLPPPQRMIELLDALVGRNAAWIAEHPSHGALLLASPGVADSPTLIIDLYPIDDLQMQRRIESGTPLVVTHVQQPADACWPRDIKVRSRLHYYLADHQAKQMRADAIGVLIDADGSVTETAIANLIAVRGDRLISPPEDQILLGVSLQVVRDLAALGGLNWTEQRLSPDELRSADEVLLTGTSCGIWFANSIDGSPKRVPGAVYQELRRRFEDFIETSDPASIRLQ